MFQLSLLLRHLKRFKAQRPLFPLLATASLPLPRYRPKIFITLFKKIADTLTIPLILSIFPHQSSSRLSSSVHQSTPSSSILPSYPQDGSILRGKGTVASRADGSLVASVCGVVERVNKLVSVRPLRSRYAAHAGDVIVGRVTEIQGKRWKLDIQSTQEARLDLSAVHIPGDHQRRHTAEDELGMRNILREGDLVAAEVQSVFHDGTVALQTRSRRFGLLKEGQVVKVAPTLVKRQKHHMEILPEIGISLVQGVNGMIFVQPQPRGGDAAAGGGGGHDRLSLVSKEEEDEEELNMRKPLSPFTAEEHAKVARVCGCIKALGAVGAMIYPAVIMDVYKASEEQDFKVAEMSGAVFLQVATLVALDRQK